MDLDLRGAVAQSAPAGARHLVPGEDHAVAPVRELVLEVVQDPPARGHPGGRDHDARVRWVVQLLGLHRPRHQGEPAGVEGVPSGEQLGPELLLDPVAERVAVHRERCLRHRAVDVDRHVRHAALGHEVADDPEQERRTVHREGGQQRDSPAPQRPGERRGQLVRGVSLVAAVAGRSGG